VYHPGQIFSRPLAEYMKEMQTSNRNNIKDDSEKETGFEQIPNQDSSKIAKNERT
jgi:hypothetical protein